MSVELIDRGYRAIKRRWDRMTRGGVEVKVGPEGPRREGDLDNVTLAFIHEFGRGRVPERPFMRATFDLNRDRYMAIFRKAGIEHVIDGDTAVRAFGRAAEAYRSDVIATINGGATRDAQGRFLKQAKGKIAPLKPLSEERRDFKQERGWSLLPLNATQQLIQSIRASKVEFRR